MKAKIFTLSLLLISQASLGMGKIIKMPNAEELDIKISSVVTQHFLTHTNLIKQLANKEIDPVGLGIVINTAYREYDALMKAQFSPDEYRKRMVAINAIKPMLFEALLKNNPDALRELEIGKFFTPMLGQSKL